MRLGDAPRVEYVAQHLRDNDDNLYPPRRLHRSSSALHTACGGREPDHVRALRIDKLKSL